MLSNFYSKNKDMINDKNINFSDVTIKNNTLSNNNFFENASSNAFKLTRHMIAEKGLYLNRY